MEGLTGGLGSSGDERGDTPVTDFEQLLELARMAHRKEVEDLKRKLAALREEAGASGSRELVRLSEGDGRGCAGGACGAPVEGGPAAELALTSGAPSEEHDHQGTVSQGSQRKRGENKGFGARGWSSENEIPRSTVASLVAHPAFEIFFSSLILFNAVLMALEAQYHGFDLAVRSGHSSAAQSAADTWPHAEWFFNVFSWIFGVAFCVEISAKIFALRCSFVRDAWNWIDLTVVVLWLISLVSGALPVNAQLVRLARLARLMRLMRLFQEIRDLVAFDSLYLMTTALRGSCSILMWTVILMVVMHLLLALLFNQLLREAFFLHLEDWPNADHALMFQYFGSFSRALLTMFELTLANWPTACRVLTENVGELFILYILAHKMVLGLAVLGVINAVFIQETFKVASLDDTVMVRQTMRKALFHKDKMNLLFSHADANGDGKVDMKEWQEICEDEWVKAWLLSQELNAHDAVTLFRMLDVQSNNDGSLSADELIAGASRLKGQASNMDVRLVLTQVANLMTDLTLKIEGGHNSVLARLENRHTSKELSI